MEAESAILSSEIKEGLTEVPCEQRPEAVEKASHVLVCVREMILAQGRIR